MKWYLRGLAVAALAALITVSGATARSASAPSNKSLPTISGGATVGSTLTANPGTWSGSSPISFQYQWQICGSNGGACHAISGATSQTYVVASADVGNTLRVRVIASNVDGSSSATSHPTAKITTPNPNVPAATSAPTISGDASIGSTLTASPGTWTGASPITFQYQWLVCDGNGAGCHNVAGATATTYVVRNGDLGNTLRVRVIGSNSSGSAAATSAATAKVTATPTPSPTGCPKLAAGVAAAAVTQVSAPARLVVDQFLPSASPITAGMTSLSVRFHVSDTCGQAVSGASVYATAVPYHQLTVPSEAITDGSGWVTLTFSRLAGFPASRTQRLLVMFTRARKPGESPLAGITGQRLISLHVNLKG
jgi:uncharacterized protein YukE